MVRAAGRNRRVDLGLEAVADFPSWEGGSLPRGRSPGRGVSGWGPTGEPGLGVEDEESGPFCVVHCGPNP
jgi:hypothetical protein